MVPWAAPLVLDARQAVRFTAKWEPRRSAPPLPSRAHAKAVRGFAAARVGGDAVWSFGSHAICPPDDLVAGAPRVSGGIEPVAVSLSVIATTDDRHHARARVGRLGGHGRGCRKRQGEKQRSQNLAKLHGVSRAGCLAVRSATAGRRSNAYWKLAGRTTNRGWLRTIT